MTLTDMIGYAGAAVGTCIMLPQVYTSYRTKKVDDLSVMTVILYVLNCILWLIYGIRIAAMPAIVANGFGLVISIAQLIVRIKFAARPIIPQDTIAPFLGCYWRHLKVLPKNYFLYVWLLLIISGNRTPRGKIACVLISILIIPLFHVWSTRHETAEDQAPADQ